MQKRRVVITGIGILAPSGMTTDAFWKACGEGSAPVEPIPAQWKEYAAYSSGIWAPLQKLDMAEYNFSPIHQMHYAQSSSLGMAAASQALENAGFSLFCSDEKKQRYLIPDIDPASAGVFAGTGVGGLVSLISNQANHILKPQKDLLESMQPRSTVNETAARVIGMMRIPGRFNPFVVSIIMPNAVSSSIGIRFGLTGPNITFTCACAAGTVAIGQGFRAIREGRIKMALAGGSEYLRDEFGGIFRGFDIAGTLVSGDFDDPSEANRPFDRDRSGFLFSEGGAAFLVIEEKEHAERRGVSGIAEICGYAETFDAYSMMSMDPDYSQMERMERMVLDDAGFSPESIDYVNAHGTGTLRNDEVEAAMIAKVFGRRPAVNSTKSLIGHTIGAAGALEAAVTALSLFHGTTHISRNIENPVEDLNFVTDKRPYGFLRAITHSFAFGGHNAALALKRIDQ